MCGICIPETNDSLLPLLCESREREFLGENPESTMFGGSGLPESGRGCSKCGIPIREFRQKKALVVPVFRGVRRVDFLPFTIAATAWKIVEVVVDVEDVAQYTLPNPLLLARRPSQGDPRKETLARRL